MWTVVQKNNYNELEVTSLRPIEITGHLSFQNDVQSAVRHSCRELL